MNVASVLTRRVSILLAALALPLCLSADVPDGWHLAGSAPNDFETGVYNLLNRGSAAFLRSRVDEPAGFGTLMQTFSATDYRGKRLRLSGALKTNDVKIWAGLWMRIDGPADERLGFDNMSNRRITGSTDWNSHEIVLDVPEQSVAIAFGVLLMGFGEVLIDDIRFDEVGQDIAVTGDKIPGLPPEPANLKFDE